MKSTNYARPHYANVRTLHSELMWAKESSTHRSR